MSSSPFWAMTVHDFKEALRTKWLITFSIVFFLLAVNIPTLVELTASYLPPNYLPVYLAYLSSLSFPYLPLLALPLGAITIVQERETRSLEYVLSTRLTRPGYFMAKLLGLLLATTAVIFLGYGVAAIIAFRLSLSHYVAMLWVILVAALLNGVMLAISLVFSTLTRRRETALGLGIFTWFYFSVVSSLSQLAIVLDTTHRAFDLVLITLLNPAESARILAVISTNSPYDVLLENPAELGGSGQTLVNMYGNATTEIVAISLLVWLVVVIALAFFFFRRQDIN